jgi:hypothetical protein
MHVAAGDIVGPLIENVKPLIVCRKRSSISKAAAMKEIAEKAKAEKQQDDESEGEKEPVAAAGNQGQGMGSEDEEEGRRCQALGGHQAHG